MRYFALPSTDLFFPSPIIPSIRLARFLCCRGYQARVSFTAATRPSALKPPRKLIPFKYAQLAGCARATYMDRDLTGEDLRLAVILGETRLWAAHYGVK